MEQLNNLDVVFLIIIGISALVGIARGMTKEVLSLIGWILAAAAIFYLVPIVDPISQKYIASKILASVVSGLFILVAFSIVWIITVDRLSAIIRASKLSTLDRILGFFFGALRGLLIVILLAMMITTLVPEESKKGVFAESRYFKEAAACAEPLKKLIPQSWVDKFNETSESLGFGKSDENDKTAENQDNSEKSNTVKTDENDEKAEDKKAKSETENVTETKNDTNSAFENPFELLDSNLEVLQKNGEELFNSLAQPKPANSDNNKNENAGPDLDSLLDELEDLVVTTDTDNTELKSETQNIKDKTTENSTDEKQQ